MTAATKKRTSPRGLSGGVSRAPLSREAQLVLMTAAAAPSQTDIRQTVDAGVDWEKLCTIAASEKAPSVLLRQLGLAGVEGSYAGCQQLRRLATLSLMNTMQLDQLLHQTLTALAQQNVPTLLLKGAGLGYTAYSSFVDRPMGDIDLLIRPDDAERTWSLLRASGWAPANPDEDADRYVGHHHLPPMFEQSTKCRLEIHVEVLPGEHPFRFSTDAFWEHARQLTVNGRTIAVPDPVHQLWHACVHFAWSHSMQWGTWRAMRDTAAIVSLQGFDWPRFVSFARETRATTCCYWTLRLARHTANADIPDDALAALRPPYPEWLLSWLERHFQSSLLASEQRCPSVRLARRLWELGMAPGWSGHGNARPWQVTERWSATSSSTPKSVRLSVMTSLRQLAAGAWYVLQLCGFTLRVATTSQMASP